MLCRGPPPCLPTAAEAARPLARPPACVSNPYRWVVVMRACQGQGHVIRALLAEERPDVTGERLRAHAAHGASLQRHGSGQAAARQG